MESGRGRISTSNVKRKRWEYFWFLLPGFPKCLSYNVLSLDWLTFLSDPPRQFSCKTTHSAGNSRPPFRLAL